MNTNLKQCYKRLRSLEYKRRELARRIDASYLRDNVSDFLSLQHKYETLMHSISELQKHINGLQSVAA